MITCSTKKVQQGRTVYSKRDNFRSWSRPSTSLSMTLAFFCRPRHPFQFPALSSNMMNNYQKNPDKPLRRRFLPERRGRAAFCSRPQTSHCD
ncbi:hypothetical protein Y032_0323g2487 [Ancylostoma ceylanicum]|uniref:Uncharacterized protein n=1 Tax=Ancylostoma ceylanicum TaxID=53326 RepID=A0A016S0U3_9BILA|nr:hypothetical protein Y032_0323g2487 [Ancylostoma ceylanicum]